MDAKLLQCVVMRHIKYRHMFKLLILNDLQQIAQKHTQISVQKNDEQ